MGVYGNENLLFIRKCQYVTCGAASDQSATFDANTEAVTLYADADCWCRIGTNPTAAAPGAEKTEVEAFFIPASAFLDVALPRATDSAPLRLAAIQDSAGGNVYIYERKSV